MVSKVELLEIIQSGNLDDINKNVDYISSEYLEDKYIKMALTKLVDARENKGIRTILTNNPKLQLSQDELIDMSFCVCYGKDVGLIEMLVERGFDVNSNIPIKSLDNEDCFYTPFLCRAVASNSVELVEFLIKKGVDVNAKNKKGYIPLHTACMGGNFEIIKLLVENGSYLNERNNKGQTPLYYAYENRSIHGMLNNLSLSEGPIEIYLKQHGANLGLNKFNLYETFKYAIYNHNFYILRDIACFEIDGRIPDIGFVSKLIIAYDEYETKEDITVLKKAMEQLPKDRKLTIYRKFFAEINEEFKAEFNKSDTIYKEFIKGDPLFFSVLNTANQILNREDNVGNSIDKLDLLTLGYNRMIHKYYKEKVSAGDDFAKEFVKSSNASLLKVMHNIKDKSVVPNIVKILNEIREDKQMFLLTNTKAGNIHNIPEAVFKIKTGPLKGKYALLLVNFGYGYNLKHLGASTVSMYIFSMDTQEKVQEVANRIFEIANNFGDNGKSALKIKDFYKRVRELFLEEDETILKQIYNINPLDTRTKNVEFREIIDKNRNRQLGITLDFANNIPKNICNCFVKQQQKILEIMFSILKTCHDNEKQDKDFDIVSFLRESARNRRLSFKYTHLDGLMSVKTIPKEKGKDKGIETKRFKKELIEEILKVGVLGFRDKNKREKRISEQEAMDIRNELWNRKNNTSLEI